jgi:hypothetical protein
MTTKRAAGVSFKCAMCRPALGPDVSKNDDSKMFDVDEASRNDCCRKQASGFWMIEQRLPMLVAESWDEDNGYVEAITLDNHIKPGFTTVERQEAKQLGKARVRIDDRGRGDLSGLLGQLFVRNGFAGISYLTGWHNIVLLQVPLADADGVPDGDYGFAWSLECSDAGENWTKVYEADPGRSWLNDWRPNHKVTRYLPWIIEALRDSLIPTQ